MDEYDRWMNVRYGFGHMLDTLSEANGDGHGDSCSVDSGLNYGDGSGGYGDGDGADMLSAKERDPLCVHAGYRWAHV